MRITESQLRRIVQGVLITEDVEGKIDSLIDALAGAGGHTIIQVSATDSHAKFSFESAPAGSTKSMKAARGGSGAGKLNTMSSPRGSVTIKKASSMGWGECSGAWAVVASGVSPGWGPLLYDVAIEWATQNGGGLTSDREEVSDDALGVWTRYMNQRGDVEKVQLDLSDRDVKHYGRARNKFNLKRITLRDKSDDCSQESSFMHQSDQWEEDEVPDWYNSPLSRVYRKAPVAMSRLKELGLLITA